MGTDALQGRTGALVAQASSRDAAVQRMDCGDGQNPRSRERLNWLRQLLVTSCCIMLLAYLATPVAGQMDWENSWPDNQSVVDDAEMLGDTDGTMTSSGQRVRLFSRSSVRWQARSFTSADGREYIAVSDSGLNIVIDNVGEFETVDISTDRLVIWTDANSLPGSDGARRAEKNYEFYMEGNIVFRQADRVIYAERMYYNVGDRYGVILDGELLTPIPGYEGLVRLKAEVLRQVNSNRIEGYQGAITTSRLGVPRYWLQSGNFVYEQFPNPALGGSSVDPITGQPTSNMTKRVTSRDNRVYLAEWPIFYWPFMSANLDRPSFYLESFQINNDSVFGTQILTEWNLFQLFGIQNAPAGTQWTASLDYLSKRGGALGTNFEYDRNSFFGMPGRTRGFLHAWGIHDTGLDNLGLGRRTLAPETDFRGRIYGRHRNQMAGGYQLTGELGIISDYNFLEQYYEEDWDQEKDETTGVELKRRVENRSWSVTGDVRVNDFFTQTNWLPRADHFWIAQPLLGDWFNWTEHSSVGYGQLQVADAPQDPAQAALFDPLAWEANVQGVRATTRHRLDLPMQWGGAKVVPYASGEAAYWGQDLQGNDLDRLVGQLGLRSSIPIVRVDPTVRNTLFNLNGLAHKVVFESEFLWADASANMTDLPLYDPLDDDAVEFFRRRFFFTNFGGVAGGNTPAAFDERFYALRGGMQRWVTAPSAEIADDLVMGRVAARQRWQTKRGMPGRQRVVDWISLDLEGFFYPNADRDNFGQDFGLVNYDFRWHVGDRFTVISDGMADFFTDGLRTISVGGIVSRPGLGRYVAGIRSIEGPISSSILYGSTSYRLSEKWIINYGSTYDFGSTGNIGQRGQIVRVGESFLVGLGFNYDSSRDNFGVRFSIEPRFMSGRLSRVGGLPIAPVGFSGLE
ncbi:MAG: hypothetical protein KDB23_11625 [Planctomycetales bacterium]|nr:hypothetical protein [Planctomycetales bacterium]